MLFSFIGSLKEQFSFSIKTHFISFTTLRFQFYVDTTLNINEDIEVLIKV
jgi:hypothetical protein